MVCVSLWWFAVVCLIVIPSPRTGTLFLQLGSSTVSDVHFGHFSHALHPGIESAATFSCHTL